MKKNWKVKKMEQSRSQAKDEFKDKVDIVLVVPLGYT